MLHFCAKVIISKTESKKIILNTIIDIYNQNNKL